MKKFIFALITIILASCTSDSIEYGYKINYTIGGVTYERIDTLPDVSPGYIPTYLVFRDSKESSNNKIMVQARVPEGQFYPACTEIIYVGNLPCSVESFDYWEIRRFKTSDWDGHEVKPRK